jgi:16S rRNA (uracil1498-N3)-methyltransferase
VQYDAKKQAKILDRWTKIAKEAAEQAHRDKVPTIEEPHSFKQLLTRIPDTVATFFCYEKQIGQGLRASIQAIRLSGQCNKPIMIVIGPEGGFTEQEIEQAVTAGAKSITLGKRILRTETAAMAALSGIMYEFGELGGE